MGRLVTFISILIFVDMMLLMTGQLSTISPTSIIVNAILDPTNITTSQWYIVLITSGLSLLTVGAAVVTGIVSRSFEIVIFIPIALAMAAMIGDFTTTYLILRNAQPILANIVIVPMMILFLFTIVEWLRGKD